MNEWVKAWRPRPGSAFEARVSPLAKDWFRGLLVHFDDEGVMHLPKAKNAHGALGMALGYPKGQRRTIGPLLAECLDHGCLVAEQDDDGFWVLRLPAWDTFQTPKRGDKRKPPTSPPTEVGGGSSTSPRTRRVPAAYPPRTQNDETGTRRGTRKSRKPPESLDSRFTEKRREEERREEEEARAREAEPPSAQRDPWAALTHHSGVWRLFEAACAEAGLDWPGMCSGLRNEDCRQLLRRIGGEALVADMRAWAAEIAERDNLPSNPWLSYADHAGSWESRAARRAARDAPTPRGYPDAAATNRLIEEREQAFRADQARRRGPGELTPWGDAFADIDLGGKS